MLEITLKNGDQYRWAKGTYTDYRCDGNSFIVIRDKEWIGIYNMDCIAVVERKED